MELHGLDLTKPSPSDPASFGPDGALIPRDGEQIFWQGQVGAVRAVEAIEGSAHPEAEKVWQLDRARLALTTIRTVAWTTDVSPGLGTSLNAGWVVAGPVGMLAHNLVKKHAARNLVGAAQVAHREVVQVCILTDRDHGWVRLTTWPYARSEQLDALDVFVGPQGATSFAQDVTRLAACDRLTRLDGVRGQYPWQVRRLQQQAEVARSPRDNGSYPLPLYFAGAGSLVPLTAERDARRIGDWELPAREQMARLQQQIAAEGDGVRTDRPAPPRAYDLGGYAFVVPGWWDEVDPPMPPAEIQDLNAVRNWVKETYGAFLGGADHWREALKIVLVRAGVTNPAVLPALYRGVGRHGQGAVAAMDIAAVLRDLPVEHPLFGSAPVYEGLMYLQAGAACRELGLTAAAQFWLRRCLCTGSGDTLKTAEKELKALEGSPGEPRVSAKS